MDFVSLIIKVGRGPKWVLKCVGFQNVYKENFGF